MACSKSFGNDPEALREEVALLAKRLCIEAIPYENISAYLSCRLVPLSKRDEGVRPVGIGETLRRIVGKTITRVLKQDIQQSCGTLQTCTGIESGIEAAIHSVKSAFDEDGSEAAMLVDADNAFNRLNRKVALQNIKSICLKIYQYLQNSYNSPVNLYLADGSHILSKEGTTQGDNAAMGMYALGIKPLIDKTQEDTINEKVMQAWFADDSTSVGELQGIKKWWDSLKTNGPKYGYYPKPSKTWIILKNPADLERAQVMFAGEGVNITCDGERHIGEVIGSEEYKEIFVAEKITNWVRDVMNLAEIAKDEPQVALSAYNVGMSKRWSFIQRTINGISHLFEPLEDAIKNHLIPSLIGREVSCIERRMLALPYRYGGLGIEIPTETADREYNASKEITRKLTEMIINQDSNIETLDKAYMKTAKLKLKSTKENRLKEEAQVVMDTLPDSQKMAFKGAQEKGASVWLSALPLQALGYTLNKQEFRDSIRLRYAWTITDMPTHCACGSPSSVDHTLTCKVGGYVGLRHNRLRDTEALLMKEVAKDVQTEPLLLPVGNTQLLPGTTRQEQARLDISARGVHSPCDRSFYDVRVTHTNCARYQGKSLEEIYEMCEKEKKKSTMIGFYKWKRHRLHPLCLQHAVVWVQNVRS